MTFLQDLRYAWRTILKSRGFLIVAVVSLGIGIGANTAIFSVLYSLIYKMLPVSDPRLLVLFSDPAAQGMSIGESGGERALLTWPEFQDLHGVKAISGLFAAQSMTSKLHTRWGGHEEDARGKMVSGAYFSVLGLHAQAGRLFDESMDRAYGGSPYVVLSDGYWARRFGRDPSVIGKTVVIDKTVFEVIGVGPRGFAGENVGENPDFWAPLSMQMQITPGMDFLHPSPNPAEKYMWLHVFGRLKPGATLQQAQAQADVIFKASLEDSYRGLTPEAKKGFMDQHLKLRPAATGASGLRSNFTQLIWVVFAAVAATLLICCANLSNLLLTRANARQRKTSVRLSLGASRQRITRELLAEGLILSALGAMLGLALSQFLAPLLLQVASSTNNPIYLDTRIDWRILSFTAAVTIATTLICSLMPAIRAARTDLMSAMREGGRGLTGSHRRLTSARSFVVAQIALSLVLLMAAGLFLRTLLNLQNVDLGYKSDRLAVVSVDMAPGNYSPETRSLLFRNVLDKLRATPGVKNATFSQNGLFDYSESGDQIEVEGYTAKGNDDGGSRFDLIGPGYFSSLGIPISQGREIDQRDAKNSPVVCVVNEAFAKQFFAGRNPIGKHVIDRFADTRTPFEVVGVVKDSRDHSLRDPVPPRVFVSLLQAKFGPEISRFAFYEVRLSADNAGMLKTLEKTIKTVDPKLQVEANLLTRSINDQLKGEKFLAKLVSLFGFVALFLAAIGVYGILAYGVSQRTNEIGVRMAIGAAAIDVVAMIARETGRMLLTGVVLGVAGAYFLTRLIESKLYGVRASDPGVATAAVLILAVIGMLAGAIPAFRASRIDPATALRNE